MINTVTLNPAMDKILYVDKFTPNVTTRIQKIDYSIGGKGTHVSINLSIMGEAGNAFGCAHGETGRRVISMLEGYGIRALFNWKDGAETRTNYLLNETTGDSTLITEPGVPLAQADIDALIETMRANMSTGDYLAFSGDASNYSDPFAYNYMISRLGEKEPKVFLDTSGESLKKCLSAQPFLIKPNLDELQYLCGMEVSSAEDIRDAIDTLSSFHIPVIAVSLGGDGSIVKYGQTYYAVTPPKVNVENTVGCGDCFLAGLLFGFSRGMEIADVLRHATAVSSAAAECALSVGFDAGRAEALKSQVTITQI